MKPKNQLWRTKEVSSTKNEMPEELKKVKEIIVGDLSVHEILVLARKRLKLNQHNLAFKTDIPQSRISCIENGSPANETEIRLLCNAMLEIGEK